MRIRFAILSLASLLASCVHVATQPSAKPIVIGPAPITYDGHVAGQTTDLVFVLEKDASPETPGLQLAAGDTLSVHLPREFKRNDQAPLKEDSDANLVLTRGWPQGAVKQAGQYRIFHDASNNAIGVRALQDIRAEGANAPGIKVIHLRGQTFINPVPGEYSIEVRLAAIDGKVKQVWAGKANILLEPPTARLAPTNFHLPPGTSSDFQKIGVNQDAPYLLGLLLWGEAGSPLNGVGIAPRDLKRYPKYTGGLLVQDSNGDKKLDPAIDKVVGGIIGAAPKGAKGQSATSPLGADGKPVLSGEVLRDPKYPGGGKSNPGLLAVRFRSGNEPGVYRPTFELLGGNGYQFTVQVR